MQKYGRLTAVLLKEKKLAQGLLEFLPDTEKIALLTTSKLLNSKYADILEMITRAKSERLLVKISENKKKASYFKVNLAKHRQTIANLFLVKSVQKSNCPDALNSMIPQKLCNQSAYACYLNPSTKRFLFVPRSWVDANLDLFKTAEEEDRTETHKLIERINLETAHISDSKAAFFARHKKLQESLIKETKSQETSDSDALSTFFRVRKFGIFMFQGGDFTFALYEDFKEVFHGSEHKYVIRAKGGGKQSTKDKTKTIKSIGSQIRRENEKVLLENIEEVIKQKSAAISACELLFVFAPGLNMNTLVKFFEAAGVPKSVIRSIGFTSGKAKYMELQKIFKRLTSLYVA